jgi:hypothetical protein
MALTASENSVPYIEQKPQWLDGAVSDVTIIRRVAPQELPLHFIRRTTGPVGESTQPGSRRTNLMSRMLTSKTEASEPVHGSRPKALAFAPSTFGERSRPSEFLLFHFPNKSKPRFVAAAAAGYHIEFRAAANY